MALLGKGVLAIWNGIAPDAEAEFVAWHVREHIPERVGLPGFLRGRRYVAVDGHPKYFNFYETETPADLTSPAYLARLNAPTEWTRKVVARFTDTSRTICDVAWSIGQGEGGAIEAIVLNTSHEPDRFAAAVRSGLEAAYASDHGLVAIHLLKGHTATARADTTESRLRGAPDQVAPWTLLIEASTVDALLRFRTAAGSTEKLVSCGAAQVVQRGLYQVQFTLTK